MRKTWKRLHPDLDKCDWGVVCDGK